ncbi:DUF4114 domain-containing protein [Flaviramulus sp. BrNp1-15]|uniref:DUF4114 domain-containing protein n=1 Tax=Flaviramulus sp. BrNp1-15 TaxID=2916754 RepID=UPI001EE799FE|nr:DUF4114 domain-containing protein [Flaviramulus sp. BrNp1-15]ULC60351.1 DUF4114 domain-containing protein [Flaviramulus sp. BrNp1-15]
MKKILLFITILLSFTFIARAQSGSISNFSFSSNPIKIGETLNFSLDYTSNVDAQFSIALLKTKNSASEIDWNSGLHWQNVNVPASGTPTNYTGEIHLSGFNQSSADIAPEIYFVRVQLNDRNTGNGLAAIGNYGFNSENIIDILPTSDVFNYNYLGAYDADGKPLYLEPVGDVISASDLETISSSLPESYPVPEYNPHYIAAGYDTDLSIQQETDVWVTFISEGAGYTNVLGYYTYDLNNPPTTKPAQEDITIIFPNASELGAGGALQPGDKVNIGRFPAGTGIGWVLLANAWNGETVAHDIWNVYSNPYFNPESDADLRHHSVLLTDEGNDRLILGFEDVRRDLDWCDNDFNDAVFFITTNPYQALKTNNYPDVTSAATVTSANNGGLESNGNLAGLIAKRNFKRKTSGKIADKKSFQKAYAKGKSRKGGPTNSLENYLPDTGMYGTETAYVSSPEDLLGITNASEVFSVDIYQNENRVSAALATKTEGSIYDHSKAICDRLNNSSLEDVRTVTVRGHNIISSKIKRATGELEFTLSFSIKLGTTSNELLSFWNIAQYPEGDYNNYQIWGNSFSQVFAIANHIIDTYASEKALTSKEVNDKIPAVFVKSGYYSNGQIHLNIVNKVAASSMTFNGSVAETEVSTNRLDIQQNITLNGDYNETVSIATGTLFDIGFSLSTSFSAQQDALYLADGPWGIDYLSEYATIDVFNVNNQAIDYNDDVHEVERQPTVSGEVKGNINLFRHLLPGDLTLDVSDYDAIKFNMFNNQAIEVILMPEELTDWNNRLRYTIPANETETLHNISFSDFKDANGHSADINNIKTVVFSVIGDYSNYKSFNLAINSLAFVNQSFLSVEDVAIDKTSLTNYPNPFKTNTIIKLVNPSSYIDIVVYDMLGRTVDMQHIVTNSKKASYNAPNLSKGIYKYKLVNDLKQVNTGTFLVE